jgi:hypothetical protein
MDAEYLLDIKPSDHTREKEGIIRRLLQTYVGKSPPPTPVTLREFQVRALDAIDGVAGDVLLLSTYHDFCAIVFIAIGLDESWEWPPFFGVISKAYTMRGFWSMFWHRVIYRSFSSHAALVSSTLGIKQRTTLARYVNGFLVFGLSAIMHAMVTAKYGNPCAWGRSMFYWILQPFAFMIEGMVQFFWGKVRRRIEGSVNASMLDVFERVVGYVWVCSWLIWEAPKRVTALMECPRP